jgi:hypothetical protein
MDHTEKERDREPKATPHRPGKKVRSEQDIEVATDELSPGHGLFALRGWRDATALEDVTDRLIANGIAEILDSSDHAVIALRAVLAGHAHH